MNSDFEIYRKSLEFFISFTDEEWSIFSEHLYVKKVARKDLFIKEGQVCKEVGFVLQGSLRLYFVKDGIEITNYFIFENEYLSSYRSFLRQIPSPENIEAMEDCILICYNFQSIENLLNDPRIAFKIERCRRMIAEHLICCYDERVISFVTKNAEERYCEIIEKQPLLLQRVPQHYIANILGVTPVSLSRIRRRIASSSLVK